jgi:hypothetical protein
MIMQECLYMRGQIEKKQGFRPALAQVPSPQARLATRAQRYENNYEL